ncbi:MAG: helix-turn-helix domain-containing protein, partial [Vulcanimicrobiota bacterium]
MTIGEKIRKLRRERNLTQDQLAEMLGIHGRHLCRYENDHNRPKQRVLKKLAEIFDVPIEEFT